MYLAKSIAASGLRNQQVRIDTIAHNVSNANTVGYKTARLDFKDALYSYRYTPSVPRSADENNQKGHGLMIAAIGRDFRNGNFERTERRLDFAIENEGFFALANESGDIVYTRNGSFHLSAEADGTYLVNGEGLYVLDSSGNRITIPLGVSTIGLGADGSMEFMVGGEMIQGATIGVFTFRNLTGLTSAGGGNFEATEAAGERLPADKAIVRQGILEMSNVNIADEMTKLIRTQRAFQLSSRALTTADDMEGIANQMRR